MDRVGGQRPVVAGRLALPQGLHEADLAVLESQLDSRADERIRLAPLPLDARLAHEHADTARLVEQQRIGARGEVAAIHGHFAAGPHPVVAFEPNPVAHDDIGLSRITGLAVFDGGPRGGEHLHRVADAADRAIVVEMGPAQYRAVAAVLRDHVLARLEPLVAEEIRGEVGIKGERRIDLVEHVFIRDTALALDANFAAYFLR